MLCLFVFHAITGAFDINGLRVMENAIEDGTCDDCIVVEDDRPIAVGTIGGDDG